jgi:hypothetical protein
MYALYVIAQLPFYIILSSRFPWKADSHPVSGEIPCIYWWFMVLFTAVHCCILSWSTRIQSRTAQLFYLKIHLIFQVGISIPIFWLNLSIHFASQYACCMSTLSRYLMFYLFEGVSARNLEDHPMSAVHNCLLAIFHHWIDVASHWQFYLWIFYNSSRFSWRRRLLKILYWLTSFLGVAVMGCWPLRDNFCDVCIALTGRKENNKIWSSIITCTFLESLCVPTHS